MTPEQHFWALKHNHEVKDEMYFIQVACTFELNGNELIQLFNDAKTAGYTKAVAREIVLAAYHITPYEEYLRCYVLSGTGKFRLKTSVFGLACAACSAAALDESTITDGNVSTAPSEASSEECPTSTSPSKSSDGLPSPASSST